MEKILPQRHLCRIPPCVLARLTSVSSCVENGREESPYLWNEDGLFEVTAAKVKGKLLNHSQKGQAWRREVGAPLSSSPMSGLAAVPPVLRTPPRTEDTVAAKGETIISLGVGKGWPIARLSVHSLASLCHPSPATAGAARTGAAARFLSVLSRSCRRLAGLAWAGAGANASFACGTFARPKEIARQKHDGGLKKKQKKNVVKIDGMLAAVCASQPYAFSMWCVIWQGSV